MSKRIHEAATLTVDPATKKFRVRLLVEGGGNSADYKREFFTPENAALLGGSLSFPGHPVDLERPEQRDPLTAIASIGEKVDIEAEEDGRLAFWSDFIPAKSRPDVSAYLAEYASKLALSVYSDSDGHDDPETGRYIAESLKPNDPYRSVDLVIAGGAGGKFGRVLAESLTRLGEASASAGEKRGNQMEIAEVGAEVAKVAKLVEALVATLAGKAEADLQAQVDEAAVNQIVESRVTEYDTKIGLITEAKLTESQSATLREHALKGEDIVPLIEREKKVLAEALELAGKNDDQGETHLGPTDSKRVVEFHVPGFGQVN